ncbi:MAG TPA: thiamine pyrophosphate-dependent enzyme [Syntrophorhabdaceae bacterium]|nr:thiamine pyrophosphate-dependent enzyme [Syntrophorhabdaceae bacterium]
MDEKRKIEKVYGFPEILTEKKAHFCPGCSHGIMTKVISEAIGEMGLEDSSIGVYGAGCAAIMYDYINIKGVAAPPGGAVGIATGIKSAGKGSLVFAYQGEGDLFYGLSSLIGAGVRGEGITIICENNLNMGISGGAMSPATPVGVMTTTSPQGRHIASYGAPVSIAEMLKDIKGIKYIARCSTHSPGAVRKTKSIIKKAFELQLYGEGTAFIEVLGMCPTNMHLTPVEAALKIREVYGELQTGEIKHP